SPMSGSNHAAKKQTLGRIWGVKPRLTTNLATSILAKQEHPFCPFSTKDYPIIKKKRSAHGQQESELWFN
ncbi:MAG: hypothetical protein NT075_26860, partial [Chloroflexi bacterium]|nr:hypothetical protein [Chloroflexota bacterium]